MNPLNDRSPIVKQVIWTGGIYSIYAVTLVAILIYVLKLNGEAIAAIIGGIAVSSGNTISGIMSMLTSTRPSNPTEPPAGTPTDPINVTTPDAPKGTPAEPISVTPAAEPADSVTTTEVPAEPPPESSPQGP